MNEIKFPCPICGQKILCDAAHAGAQTSCPNCKNRISVPRGFDDLPPPRPTPAAPPAVPPKRTGPTSALAIASLICSLASLVVCVGWLPGIICGHLARARIRRNPNLQGNGIALAGLVIGYATMVLAICAVVVGLAHFGTAIKQEYQRARQEWAAARPGELPTQPGVVSNATRLVRTPQISQSPKFGWTLDLKDVQFPDSPVSGKIHGADFAGKRAVFANGSLKIFSETAGYSVTIPGLGASIENSSHDFLPASGGDAPQIIITWNEDGQAGNGKFSTGYAMKLTFNKAAKRKVRAQIYLCLPDDSKSYIAGSFEVNVPKKKP